MVYQSNSWVCNDDTESITVGGEILSCHSGILTVKVKLSLFFFLKKFKVRSNCLQSMPVKYCYQPQVWLQTSQMLMCQDLAKPNYLPTTAPHPLSVKITTVKQ